MSATRASIAELWIRQRALVGALNSSVLHDLNNLLATIATNAYLLRGPRSEERAQALASLEAAAESAGLVSARLEILGVRPLRDRSLLRVEDAIQMVRPLLVRLGRDDVTLTAEISPGTADVLVGSSLFQHGFLTLAALAAELAAPGSVLVVAASQGAQPRCVEVSLTLAGVQVPDFLALVGEDVATGLGIGQLVRWLARHDGGDLMIETPTGSSGLRFNLRLPEAQSEAQPSANFGGA